MRHCRRVDEAQPDALAGPERGRPVTLRRLPVDQESVAADVFDVGRVHPHVGPHETVFDQGGRVGAGLVRIAGEGGGGAAVVIVIARVALEVGDHVCRVLVRPVRQLDDVVALVAERVRPLGLDDDRSVDAGLLLGGGMAVIPVGSGLDQREAILVRLARGDALEAVADTGHAVLPTRQQQAMPVDRRLLAQPVSDVDDHRLALAEAQRRRRQLSVDGHRRALGAGDVHHAVLEHEVEHAGAVRRRDPALSTALGPAPRPGE